MFYSFSFLLLVLERKTAEVRWILSLFSQRLQYKTSLCSPINAYPAFFSKHRSVPESLLSKDFLAENDAKINCFRSHLPRLSGIPAETDELDLAPIVYFKIYTFSPPGHGYLDRCVQRLVKIKGMTRLAHFVLSKWPKKCPCHSKQARHQGPAVLECDGVCFVLSVINWNHSVKVLGPLSPQFLYHHSLLTTLCTFILPKMQKPETELGTWYHQTPVKIPPLMTAPSSLVLLLEAKLSS